MNWMASAISSGGSGGGLVLSATTASWMRSIMRRQSCTQTRTSASTFSIAAISSARRAASSMRSIWMWMKLSRCVAPADAPAPNAVSRPAGSRATVKMGCTTRRISTPCSASSPMTESSRNGMSSLTISSTEICLSRSPPATAPGDASRSLGAPAWRSPRNAQAVPARAASSAAW